VEIYIPIITKEVTKMVLNEKELIQLCKRMINIKSYSGEENNLVEFLKEKMIELGYDEVSVDEYGNIIGKINGKGSGKTVLFDGHVDTVPVQDESLWIHKPFKAEIEDGKIYGRGASDMKGALASMIFSLASLKKNNILLDGDVYVSGTVHEECFEGVALGKVIDRVKPDYVVIGEASDLKLKVGQKGRAEVSITTKGKSAHSSNPEVGINAVYKMMDIVRGVKELTPSEHPSLGKGIIELTDIKSNPYPGASVVPENCTATYDRRLLVGETKDTVIDEIKNVIDELFVKDDKLSAKVEIALGENVCYTGKVIKALRFFPAWLMDIESNIVKGSLEGMRKAGIPMETSTYYFCTNGSCSAGERNIPTIGFGPSLERLAHVVDEYIEIDQLVKSCNGYMNIALELSKQEIF
jgi:putative selenium metabolism hydrolase